MALKNRANFGPEHTTTRAFTASGGQIPKHTFQPVATTATNALAPTAAHRWLKYDGSVPSPPLGGFQIVRASGQSYTPSTYWWGVLVDLVIEGTFSASDERLLGLFGSSSALYVIFSDSNTYKLRLKVGGNNYDTTTTADLGDRFGGNTNPGIRIQRDGVRSKLWVNSAGGTPEIDVADTTYPNSKLMEVRGRGASPNWGTDEQYYIAGVGHWDSAVEDDRPGYGLKHYYIIGNGNVITQYADEVSCSNADGVYQDVLPSGSRAEDATTKICALGIDTDVFEFDTATVTLSDGGWGGSMIEIRRTNIVSKTVHVDHGIDDGTNTIDIASPNIAETTWHGCATHFETAPDGGAWTQGDVDNLKLRFVSKNTNGAEDNHFFSYFEMISVDNDPPGTAARNLIIT